MPDPRELMYSESDDRLLFLFSYLNLILSVNSSQGMKTMFYNDLINSSTGRLMNHVQRKRRGKRTDCLKLFSDLSLFVHKLFIL